MAIDIPDVDINVDIKPVVISKAIISEDVMPPVLALNTRFYVRSDKPILTTESEEELMILVKTLQDHPSVNIFIVGNTADPRKQDGILYGNTKDVLKQVAFRINGEDVSVGQIMKKRAKAIYDYLIRKGIDPKRLDYGTGNHRVGDKYRKITIEKR